MKKYNKIVLLLSILLSQMISTAYGQTCSGTTPANPGTLTGTNYTGININPSDGLRSWFTGGTLTGANINISSNSTLIIKTGSFITLTGAITIPSGSIIYIESGAGLSIPGSLTVQGTLTNLGSLTITGSNFLQLNGGAVYNNGTITASNSYLHLTNLATYTFINGGSATFTWLNWQIATGSNPVCLKPGSIFNLLSSNSGSVVAGSGAFPAGGLFQYNATDISSNSSCTPVNPARINYVASFTPTNGVVWGPSGLFANNANITIVGSTPNTNGTGSGFGSSTRVISGTGYNAATPQNFNLITHSPVPTVTGNYFEYCLNAVVPLASMATGSNLLWYTVVTGGIGSSTAPTVVSSSAGLQTFWVSQNVTGSCEGPRNPININILSTAASALTAGNNGPVCAGGTLSLSSAGFSPWNWTGPSSYTSTVQNPTVSASATAAMSGTYTVIAFQNTGSCFNSASTTVVVNSSAPAQPSAFTTSSSTVCKNQNNVTYTVPAVVGATSYNWSYSGAGTNFSSTTNTVSINFSLVATSGTLSVTATNGCGTSSARSLAITVDGGIFQLSTTNMIAYYKFNGNANDETNNDQGTLQNAPTSVADRFGNANSAYSFNGTNQYVTTANSYNNPTNFSFSVWFQTTTLTGGKIIEFGNAPTGGSGNYDRQIYMANSGQLYLAVNPGGVGHVVNTSLGYNDGKWHNVIGTISSINGMKLYVDGALIASDASATGGQSFTGYWRMAYDNTGAWTNSPSSQYFNGSLDDVMIYHRELTSTEVSTAYNAPDGAASNSPVCIGGTLNLTSVTLSGATYAWTGPSSFSVSTQNTSVSGMNTAKSGTYSLTVTSGSCIYKGYALGNISNNLGPAVFTSLPSGTYSHYALDGNANDDNHYNQGAFLGTPSTTTDRFGVSNAVSIFDGSTQYMETSVPYVNPVDFTISCWFKTTTTSGGKLLGFAAAQTGIGGSYDRHIYMNNAGQLYFGVYASGIKILKTATGMVYNDNVWHNVVGTLSSTAGVGLSLYVDGVLIGNDPTTTSADPFTGYWRAGYGDLSGSWPSQPTSLFFNGTLDDIYIYTRALTGAEVTTLCTGSGGVSNNGPVCVGSTVTLSSTAAASTAYAWSGAAILSPSSTVQNPTFTYTNSNGGGYTLVATNASTGCVATAYTFVSPNTTMPGQWTGYTSNSWQTANNWCGGSVPSSTVDVTIPVVATLPVNSGTANAKNITINASATLTNATTGILNVYGNYTNNGTFTDNSIYTSGGVVNFIGSTTQSITGVSTFKNLTLNNAAGLTLSSTTTVKGILTLTTGTLNTGGMLNQDLYNGAIAGTGAGTTSGNIRFFKTIWGDCYHYLSVPISGMTAADWNDNVTIKFGANSNLFSYNEALPDTNKKVGWTAIASTATALSTMKGYALFFPRWIYNTTLDVTGAYTHGATFNTGTLNNTPSSTPSFKPASDGWQLVGNAYPSDIDWNAAAGWTKTGLDDAIYTWDGKTKKYVSYVASVGANGGTRYIGSMQGFFVRVSTSGGTGSLAMNNNVRVTSILHDVWRTTSEDKLLRLKVVMASDTDETIIRFSKYASEQFDHNLDAYKLLNDSNVPSLFSISSDADYSINSLPNSLLTKTIPLQLNVMTAGEHTWTADLSNFTNGETFYLEDRLLGTSQSLNDNPTYSLSLQKGELKNRFFIRYSKRESLVTENNNATSNGGIEISAINQNVFLLFADLNTGNADITIFDALGKKIYSTENASISSGRFDINLPLVNTGIYIVKAQTSTASKTQQVFVQK